MRVICAKMIAIFAMSLCKDESSYVLPLTRFHLSEGAYITKETIYRDSNGLQSIPKATTRRVFIWVMDFMGDRPPACLGPGDEFLHYVCLGLLSSHVSTFRISIRDVAH